MKNVITDFSATGNGTTDDTTALQTALDAVGTGGAYAGQQLLFPAGTYKITSSLLLNRTGNYNLLGEGPSASVLSYTGTGVVAIIQGNGAAVSSGFTVEKIGFVSATPGGIAYGFAVGGANPWSALRFRNCKFSGFYLDAIRLAKDVTDMVIDGCEFTANGLNTYPSAIGPSSDIAGGMNNSIISNCYFHDTGYTSGLSHSIYINSTGKNVTIRDCRFVNCFQQEIDYDGSGGGAQNFYGFTVSGCTFVNGYYGDNISLTSCSGVTITNNSSQNGLGGGYFVTVGANTTGFNISGNALTCTGSPNGGTGVNLAYGGSGGLISNNVFSSYGRVALGAAVIFDAGNDVIITGNTIINFQVGVGFWNDNPGSLGSSRVRISNNFISILPGATPASGYLPWLTTPATAACLLNGLTTDVYIGENVISGYTYGAVMTNQNATDSGSPTNIIIVRNRLTRIPDDIGAGVYVKPGVTVINLAIDNNFGRSDLLATGATVTNLRRTNNALDGAYFSQPGGPGSQTIL